MAFHSKQLPSTVPKSSRTVAILLILTSMVTSTTYGYDGSMMTALNILPSYTDYFTLTTATLGLNTGAVYIGCVLSSFAFAKLPDYVGRRYALFYGAITTLIGVVLQTAAQHIAMFVVGRIVIGFGVGACSIAAPVYLAETLPVKWRAWGIGIYFDFWYVGALISAGVTYGTAQMDSTWAWRLPSLLQGLFSLMCLVLLPFVPESPRWLQASGYHDEARVALAQIYSNGDIDDEQVVAHLHQISAAIAFEQSHETVSALKMLESPSLRRRLFIVASVALFSMLSGNAVITYYLGKMLTGAGITDSNAQLKINICLNAWCLVISLFGTSFADSLGRKPLAAISTALMVVFMFMFGALTCVYGLSTNTSAIYATVASIFFFQGSYSLGWTPLCTMYPPEILNYGMRSTGMAFYTFIVNGTGLFNAFTFPFALKGIGWKMYMIQGTWDIIELAVVLFFYVETKGKTLEEIDVIFEGERLVDTEKVEQSDNSDSSPAIKDFPIVKEQLL
ncbi:Lactose permease [Lachnellula arida]|uniref:Lactose permease n=1 Tax=Lachnellula arida TaxID=1316785 RepID=A0A8T9BFS1_9HELO|nr:Lactose permease [Lachnellula arida]